MFAAAVYRLPLRRSRLLRISLLSVLGFYINACSTLAPTTGASTSDSDTQVEPLRVALVLGGGGAKGFAHVGVIKALEANGIKPTLVVGTSVGSLIGSLYASGYTPAELERLALTTTDSQLTDFTLSNQGFIEGIKLKNFINNKVGKQAIEDFPIAFAAVAAEKNSLKKSVFTTGDAGLAVQASCSVPNIFIAPRIPEKVGKKYVDGGVVSLVPVDSARDLGADIVIAVDVTAAQSRTNSTSSNLSPINKLSTISTLSDFWGLLETNIMATTASGSRSSSMRLERDRADIIITPDVGHISAIDSSQRSTLIKAGTQATTPQINAIKQLIQEKSKQKYATL
ncbi:patatin-like phospholipase family protein [Psychrobacter sp. NG254]|uniref:patatin-like phospholipase family protein n=1 Tax=Psychrobacter sp. NG254 TaxID=2782003 RepID=UPI00188964D3|nr:patatin-like phospholipase family protein [Psychrobacter sp. NG254]MBF2720592.1 patatin-like phospholipase family protein [Psychrobacter sp. NG254]